MNALLRRWRKRRGTAIRGALADNLFFNLMITRISRCPI
jgi:hypothetical protein